MTVSFDNFAAFLKSRGECLVGMQADVARLLLNSPRASGKRWLVKRLRDYLFPDEVLYSERHSVIGTLKSALKRGGPTWKEAQRLMCDDIELAIAKLEGRAK